MILRALSSALLYTLAFNLTFFVQELFLVVPKALTPGLHPTLFHNNHHWEGTSPLAALSGLLLVFQLVLRPGIASASATARWQGR